MPYSPPSGLRIRIIWIEPSLPTFMLHCIERNCARRCECYKWRLRWCTLGQMFASILTRGRFIALRLYLDAVYLLKIHVVYLFVFIFSLYLFIYLFQKRDRKCFEETDKRILGNIYQGYIFTRQDKLIVNENTRECISLITWIKMSLTVSFIQ